MATVLRHARIAASLALLALIPITRSAPAAGQGSQPNILVIVTDDQRAMDTLEHMPRTLAWFAQGGTSFTEAFATTPLCCPSRAAIMTGRLNHNNNVRTNGDQAQLDHTSTVQRYLSQAGYRTGMAGKFLNLWPVEQNPPHFDRWALLRPENSGYYNGRFNIDGNVQTVAQYSTDKIRDYALGVLNAWESDDAQPWYLYLTPYAPHDPADPEARHASATFPLWPGNPAVFEADKSDKPPSVKGARRTYEEALATRDLQLKTLLAVDEMVDAVLQELEARGEQNTLAFFVSDNGFFWSEHGLRGKDRPYTEAIKIPFLMRWPGQVEAGATHASPVANIQLTHLFADGNPRNDPWAPALARELEALKTCAGEVCRELFRERGLPRRCPGAAGKRGHHLVGSDTRDSIGGHPWRNVLCGRKGRDKLRGKGGADRLLGGPGRDVLVAGPGKDLLDGGPGRDVCRGGPGKDRFRSCRVESG